MGVVYGLIRSEPALPSREAQVLALEGAGAEILLEDGEGAGSAQRIRRLLPRLQLGDSLVVYDIAALGQGEEMLWNLRLALDQGVRVHVAEAALTLGGNTSIESLLNLATPRDLAGAAATS